MDGRSRSKGSRLNKRTSKTSEGLGWSSAWVWSISISKGCDEVGREIEQWEKLRNREDKGEGRREKGEIGEKGRVGVLI